MKKQIYIWLFVLACASCTHPKQEHLDFFGVPFGLDLMPFMSSMDTVPSIHYADSLVEFDFFYGANVPVVFLGDSARMLVFSDPYEKEDGSADGRVCGIEFGYHNRTPQFFWQLYDDIMTLYGTEHVKGVDTCDDGSLAPYFRWYRPGGYVQIQSYGQEPLNIYIDYNDTTITNHIQYDNWRE